jgi:Tfp pilus assembly protein PilN
MRAVNLLPEDSGSRKSFRKEDPAVVVGSALGAVVLMALLAGFMNVHAKVNAEQKKLTAARSELAQLSLIKRQHAAAIKPVEQKTIVPVPAVTAEEQPRLDALTSAMSSRIAWDRILREFSLVLPSDVTLTSLTMAAPAAPAATVLGAAPAPVSAVQGLTIAGSATSHDGVARLLSRMMLIPDLTNVTLGNSAETASTSANGSPGTGVQFSISAQVKGAVAPPAAAVPAAVPPASTDTTSTGATS